QRLGEGGRPLDVARGDGPGAPRRAVADDRRRGPEREAGRPAALRRQVGARAVARRAAGPGHPRPRRDAAVVVRAVPRSDLGRGAGPHHAGAVAHQARTRRRRARLLLFGQVLERGELSPHAHVPWRARHQQHRPLHAPVPFDLVRQAVGPMTPSVAARLTGVPAERIQRAAELYAAGPNTSTLWAMGLTQHANGTDLVASLLNLMLACGMIGRWGAAMMPVRGQNNVQGASDVGAIPFVYTYYRSDKEPKIRAEYARVW